jgi:hypothetical protein
MEPESHPDLSKGIAGRSLIDSCNHVAGGDALSFGDCNGHNASSYLRSDGQVAPRGRLGATAERHGLFDGLHGWMDAVDLDRRGGFLLAFVVAGKGAKEQKGTSHGIPIARSTSRPGVGPYGLAFEQCDFCVESVFFCLEDGNKRGAA